MDKKQILQRTKETILNYYTCNVEFRCNEHDDVIRY